MRRDFGSDVPKLVDAKMTARNILLVYAAAAEAIEKWEPRFRMLLGSIDTVNAQGQLVINIFGVFYPRGHTGDYSIAEDASTRIVFGGF